MPRISRVPIRSLPEDYQEKLKRAGDNNNIADADMFLVFARSRRILYQMMPGLPV